MPKGETDERNLHVTKCKHVCLHQTHSYTLTETLYCSNRRSIHTREFNANSIHPVHQMRFEKKSAREFVARTHCELDSKFVFLDIISTSSLALSRGLCLQRSQRRNADAPRDISIISYLFHIYTPVARSKHCNLMYLVEKSPWRKSQSLNGLRKNKVSMSSITIQIRTTYISFPGATASGLGTM